MTLYLISIVHRNIKIPVFRTAQRSSIVQQLYNTVLDRFINSWAYVLVS